MITTWIKWRLERNSGRCVTNLVSSGVTGFYYYCYALGLRFAIDAIRYTWMAVIVVFSIYSHIGHGFGLGHWDERVNS